MLFPYFHKKAMPGIVPPKEFIPHPVLPTKDYFRFPQISLPHNGSIRTPLEKVIEMRESRKDFDPQGAVSLADLSHVLWGACERASEFATVEPKGHRRHYPSAGGLTPLEIYVIPQMVEGLKNHAYHYNPLTHALEELAELPGDFFPSVLRYPFTHDASALVLVSAMWERITLKYGELSYRIVHLEAGHLMQNLLLLATEKNLLSRPLAGIVHEPLEKLLDFEDGKESLIYAAVFGVSK